ncbi:MAG: UPF0280 family protein [Planctomycetota bacterium]|jgi:ApbE superfamily uncharacterized protein (UPF0280 family)
MSKKRKYRTFTYKEAVFRICCSQFDAVTSEILRQRRLLEEYIERHRDFRISLEPLELLPDAPEVARRMGRAAKLVGVGPMAAVAGAMAQCAAEAGIKAGTDEAIVENGGDIYIQACEPVIIALATGAEKPANRLGFALEPSDTPISICSSSGKMGHSKSLGECDLAAVVASDAALADAAATRAANLVGSVEDVNPTLERIVAVQGVAGVLIAKADRIGFAGKLPPLLRIGS